MPKQLNIRLNGPKPRRRGRPRFVFSSKTKRRLLRLFLFSSLPLERITRIVAELGGPNRLSLRACLEELTGAGRRTNLGLRDLRLHAGKEQVGAAAEHTVTEPQDKCPKCGGAEQGMVALGAARIPNQEEASSAQSEWQDDTRGTSTGGAFETVTNQPGWDIEQQMPLTSEVSWSNPNRGLEDSAQMETQVDLSTLETSAPLNSIARNPSGINESSNTGEPISIPARQPYRVEKCREKVIRWTQLALALDGGKPGSVFHLVKCCSISAPTITHRTSSTSSECDVRTAGSEYKLFYANPQTSGSWSALDDLDGSAPSSESATTGDFRLHGPDPFFVHILLDGRLQERSDEEIESRLRDELTRQENVASRNFINHADRRGVTALHLCVAYGLEKSCGLLVKMGADIRVRTAKGTCISHFAKPAEFLAGITDQRLYYRIIHSGMFVEQGKVPPVPTATPNTERKKRRSSVPESASVSAVASQSHTGLGRKRARVRSSSQPVAAQTRTIMTGIEDSMDRFYVIQPQFAQGLSFSPANTFHCNPSASDFQDFAIPTIVRHGLPHQTMRNPALAPYSDNVGTTNGPHPFNLGSTVEVNDFVIPEHFEVMQEQSSPTNLDNYVEASRASPTAEPVQSTEAYWPTNMPNVAVSMAEALPLGPLSFLPGPVHSQEGPNLTTQFDTLHSAHQRNLLHNPDPERPNYNDPLPDTSQNLFGLPIPQSGNETDDLVTVPMEFQPNFPYCHCRHGYPRNYEISCCPLRCSKLVQTPEFSVNNA